MTLNCLFCMPEMVKLSQWRPWRWWEGKVNILGGDSISYCEKKKQVHMNICLILNDYQDTDVWICRPNSFTFLFVRLDEQRSLQKVDTRVVISLAFWMRLPAKNVKICSYEYTRDLRTRVAKWTDVGGEIFEHLLWAVRKPENFRVQNVTQTFN
jgi:hypothetical protein